MYSVVKYTRIYIVYKVWLQFCFVNIKFMTTKPLQHSLYELIFMVVFYILGFYFRAVHWSGHPATVEIGYFPPFMVYQKLLGSHQNMKFYSNCKYPSPPPLTLPCNKICGWISRIVDFFGLLCWILTCRVGRYVGFGRLLWSIEWKLYPLYYIGFYNKG